MEDCLQFDNSEFAHELMKKNEHTSIKSSAWIASMKLINLAACNILMMIVMDALL